MLLFPSVLFFWHWWKFSLWLLSENNSNYLRPEQQQQDRSSHCVRQCSPTKAELLFPCNFGVGFPVESAVICLCVTQRQFFLITRFPPPNTRVALWFVLGIPYFLLRWDMFNSCWTTSFSYSNPNQLWLDSKLILVLPLMEHLTWLGHCPLPEVMTVRVQCKVWKNGQQRLPWGTSPILSSHWKDWPLRSSHKAWSCAHSVTSGN